MVDPGPPALMSHHGALGSDIDSMKAFETITSVYVLLPDHTTLLLQFQPSSATESTAARGNAGGTLSSCRDALQDSWRGSSMHYASANWPVWQFQPD